MKMAVRLKYTALLIIFICLFIIQILYTLKYMRKIINAQNKHLEYAYAHSRVELSLPDASDKKSLAWIEDITETSRGVGGKTADINTTRKPLDEDIYILPPQAVRSRFVPEKTDVISACLLVKDDNHILPEWIAYHYTQLPLRHLVVGVDPLSNSPPTEILRRWNRTSSKHLESDEYPNMDMEIQMWGDEQIYRGMDPEEAFKNASYIAHLRKNIEGEEVIRLNNRLMFFFSRCMEYHKLQGRTWVLLIDSDEFLTFNYMHSNDVTDPPRPAIQELAPKLSNESLGQLRWWRRRTNYQMDVQKRLPLAETTTIAEFILAEADQHPWKFEDIACYSFPRLMYGAQESEESQVRAGVPDGVDPYKLQTLRFIRHSPKIKNNKNRSGKNMIDVSRLSLKDLWKTSGSPHHTLENECWQEFRFNTILRANHYLGSWEDWSARSDKRRNRREFNTKKNFREKFEDNDVRPWIKKFHDTFGEKGINLLNFKG